jgi:2-dehydro-3-deoxyphosphogalactonate aldolase
MDGTSATSATSAAPAWPPRLPLVAILRGIRPDEVLAHARVLVDAGFDCIEVPTHSPQWATSVERLARAHGEQVLVGAGTISTPAQLEALRAAGGRLMVTPHTDPALVRTAVAHGLATLVGCTTASEAYAAVQAGAHALKLFPAAALGTAYVSALRPVLPAQVPLLAVGGVRPANLGDFLRAGCAGAGLGSELYRPGQAPETTAAQARAYLEAWHAAAPAAARPPAAVDRG